MMVGKPKGFRTELIRGQSEQLVGFLSGGRCTRKVCQNHLASRVLVRLFSRRVT